MIGISLRSLKKDQIILLTTGIAATVLMLVLFQARPQLLRFLDYKLYDQFLIQFHSDKATDTPVVVDIDEKSLKQYGQWPWPRYRVAILLQYLRSLGVKSVATDIIFAEPDMTSPDALQEAWARDLSIEFDFNKLPKALMDNDKLLADNLRTGPFVLGIDFIKNKSQDPKKQPPHFHDCTIKPITVNVMTREGYPDPETVLGGVDHPICPVPILGSAAPAVGFITIAADEDSIYRRAPLLISWNGKYYPSLALASLMQALGTNSVTLKMSPIGIESIRIGSKLIIPTDLEGRVNVNYRGQAKTFEYISASDVLSRKVPSKHLENRIVFIGTSASGLKDIRSMPLDPGYPGVETHATIVDNILSNQFIKRPGWAFGAELATMILTGIITTLLLIWASALWIAVPVIAMALCMWFGSVFLYTKYLFYLSPLYPLISLALTFTLITVVKFWREERAKRFIHGAFAHYLAPSVISQIMDAPEALSLEGQEKEITIQFSDIRSFTSLSEKLSPTQVTNLLHDYLTPMTRIITEHQGTLDKFIGDAVMAFWNAPLDIKDHQSKALKAALKQLEVLDELNNEFRDKYRFTIDAGIGLHSGSVRVGNMGSADLFDYTLIGDNVNLASRLEGLTKFYGQRLIVSEAIVTTCTEECQFRILDTVRVKGRNEPIIIFGAYTREEALRRRDEFKTYDEAYNHYLNKNFNEAKILFEALNSLGTEPKLYSMYVERATMLEANPPEENWDGVFSHSTK